MAASRILSRFAQAKVNQITPKRAMLTTVLLFSLALSPSAFGQDAETVPAPAVDLFVTSPQDESDDIGSFTPIDPATLLDLPDAQPLDLNATIWNVAASADGSTLATVEVADMPLMSTELAAVDLNDVSIVIRNGAGTEQARFSLPPDASPPQQESYSAQFLPHLNRDGSRLAIQIFAGGPWCIFDTRDGRLLTLIQPPQSSLRHDWIDRDVTRLYHLVAAPLTEEPPSQPQPTRLVAYDLDTGAEIGGLELPDAPAGFWQTDRTIQDQPVLAYAMPGIALSPDGSQLAVAHANADAITLIDTEQFAVERTLEITQPLSKANQILGLIGLRPQSAAAATLMDQSIRNAVYSADGQHLYLSGIEHTALDDGEVTSSGHGLRLVDLQDGTVLAEAFPDGLIDSVLPTTDGHHLYVTGLIEDDSAAERFALRLLDANTLDPIAERAFPTYQWVLLHPSPANRE